MTFTILAGSCIDHMQAMDDNSVDAVVCDPPYELTSIAKRFGPGQKPTKGPPQFARQTGGFMGKVWDASGIAFSVELWSEVLRVLKPGGHCLAFGHPRTDYKMKAAMDEAGFEILNTIYWLYGSGFPHGLDIGKQLQKQGKTELAEDWDGWNTALKPACEPIAVGRKPLIGTYIENIEEYGTGALNIGACRVGSDVRTSGGMSSLGVMHDDNWQPKDIEKHSVVGRWPANVIFDEDAAAEVDRQSGANKSKGGASRFFQVCKFDESETLQYNETLRNSEAGSSWEKQDQNPNIRVESGTPQKRDITESQSGIEKTEQPDLLCTTSGYGSNTTDRCQTDMKSTTGTEISKTIPSKTSNLSMISPTSDYTPGVNCEKEFGGSLVAPAENANRSLSSIGTSPSKAGQPEGDADRVTSDRFAAESEIDKPDFVPWRYQAKPSRREREEGLDDLPYGKLNRVNPGGLENEPRFAPLKVKNTNPCVKPVALLAYLCRLVTPVGGTIYDPFAGSGSTGVAAIREGFDFIGSELTEEYVPIAKARCGHAERVEIAKAQARAAAPRQLRLID